MNLMSFHYLLKHFIIHKTFVGIMFFNIINIECVFRYSNLHHMFLNLLWALTYFIKRSTFVYPLGAHVLNHLKCMYHNVVDCDLKHL
jgi:hypothetical protein